MPANKPAAMKRIEIHRTKEFSSPVSGGSSSIMKFVFALPSDDTMVNVCLPGVKVLI